MPQGGLTSPKLFNVYIDDLMDELDVLGIHSQFFADDGVVVARNKR